jgi:hypothetical protein
MAGHEHADLVMMGCWEQTQGDQRSLNIEQIEENNSFINGALLQT